MSAGEIASWALAMGLFLVTVTVHEFSHGLVAFALGDDTAKRQGRLTLNPLRHIDPWWTVLLPLLLLKLGLPAVGMARPVPVDFTRLRSPKRDMVWVALAGPGANLALAACAAFLYRSLVWEGWLAAFYINAALALFNLIPIPPLDGSRLVTGLLPLAWARQYVKMEPYGFLIILALVWMGGVRYILVPALDAAARLAGLPGLR